MPPKTHSDFDRAYQSSITPWGDVRVPEEVAALVRDGAPGSVLEFGCGLGRFSRYVAGQGVRATGVDFSAVAIEKARARVAGDARRPEYLVGDVTDLRQLSGPFDAAFDVGCFHCLDTDQQARYASEAHRLLAPGGTVLIWALNEAPSGQRLSPQVVEGVFAPRFDLREAKASRRRLARSHWYWLTRSAVTPS